jgi:hypothetical protein
MLFPETWCPIKDCAPGRKEFFIDLPSLELAPVIVRRGTLDKCWGEIGWWFAV